MSPGSRAALAVAASLFLPAVPSGAAQPRLMPVDLSQNPAFERDDHLAAFRVFADGCAALLDEAGALRRARPPTRGLESVCRAALADPATDGAGARAFFLTRFAAFAIAADPQPGEREDFLTGYYEPEMEGSPVRAPGFDAPVLSRPDGLVTVDDPGDGPAALLQGPDGSLGPVPDRAAIEAGALRDRTRPLLWLRDGVELFMMQVQGSGRARMPDGRVLRLTYAGRNGLPYTSVGRLAAEAAGVPPEAMTLEPLKSWLRAQGLGEDGAGTALMRRNRSYVFFEATPLDDPARGPTGGAGVPLTPLRSIAIDRRRWSYGLPFWIEADLPDGPFARLTVAQDTGSAILGNARADIFFGTGEEAGRRAGAIRHPGRFIVLLPREDAPKAAPRGAP